MPPITARQHTHPDLPQREHPAANPLVNYELTGAVRWLDVPLERIVLAVRDTDGHAGSFLGSNVTVDLELARLGEHALGDLVPGTELHVKLRMPRDLGHPLPDLLQALSVAVL